MLYENMTKKTNVFWDYYYCILCHTPLSEITYIRVRRAHLILLSAATYYIRFYTNLITIIINTYLWYRTVSLCD